MRNGISKIVALLLCLSLCSFALADEVLTGTASGYGGAITAEVTMDADGRIVGLTLTGEQETPAIGGQALEPLTEAILANGGIDGVDAVAGATWTSNGVFAAIRNALGVEEAAEAGETKALEAAGLSQGIAIVSTGRLGPGKDDQGVGVYSFNEVYAYLLFDEDGRILDLEVDQLEIATPNYDGETMPHLTGFPGQSYNADENHDEAVDTVLEQTEETYLAEIEGWKTKRERGTGYKLNSGAWEDEMDIYEEAFRGMTVDEIEAWFASSFSDANGRPLFGTSSNEKDVAKYEAMTDEQKAAMDAISGATMSLNDAHGDILSALRKAYETRVPVAADSIAKIGLGVSNVGRLGPGKDDTGASVYSFNSHAVGVCFDADGKVVAMLSDLMEVATPNYDGEYMPDFTGFPGQSYNADSDHDEKVDATWEQTEESFLAQVASWRSKRERGATYKLNSGTWSDEMTIYENHFAGMTADEIAAWFKTMCSDANGRPLRATSSNEADQAKYAALSDEQKAELDAISGATMSLQDAHGDFMTALAKVWEAAKDTSISLK